MVNFIKRLFKKETIDETLDYIVKTHKAIAKIKYELNFITGDKNNKYSLISYKGIKSLEFKENIDNYYDDETISIKLIYPTIIKKLIDKVGIKKIETFDLIDEFKQESLILKNGWFIYLELLSHYKFDSSGVDGTENVFLVCISNESKTIDINKEKIEDSKRSNCGGICWVAEKTIKYAITQKGLKEIGLILNEEFSNDIYFIKG